MKNQAVIEPDTGLDLEELFVAHEAPLLRFAHKLTMNADTAQDLVQEAFIRLSSRLEEVRQPRAWLYATVRNQAMNHLRAQGKIVPLPCAVGGEETVEAAETPLPAETLEQRERTSLVRVCLERLPERERMLISLKYHQGLSYQQIAQRMGMTVSNVGYVLHHALKTLELELRAEGVAS